MRATTPDETVTDSKETIAEMMRLLVCSDLRKNLILSLKMVQHLLQTYVTTPGPRQPQRYTP